MNENKLNNDIKENIEPISTENVEADINTEKDIVSDYEKVDKRNSKLAVPTVIMLGLGFCLGSSLVMLKKYENESVIVKDIVSVSSLKDLDGEVIDITKYITDNYPRKHDLMGEYGGGEGELGDGKVLTYSNSSDGKSIDIKILDEDESIIFKTKLIEENYTLNIANGGIVEDELLLDVNYYDEAGGIDENSILKFNLNGEFLSKFSIGKYYQILNISETGNLIAYVADDEKDVNAYDKVVKFNKDGDKLFEYSLSDKGKVDSMHRIFETKNGETILITYSRNRLRNEVIFKYHVLDKKGNEIYRKDLKNKYSEYIDVIQTSDGGFIVAKIELLNSDNYNYRLKSVSKVDAEFNDIWTKDINKVVDSYSIEKFGNEYVIFAQEYYGVAGANEAKNKISSLTKISSTGELAWCKYFAKDSTESNPIYVDLNNSLYVNDEGLVINATVFEENASTGYLNLVVDSNGNITEK